MCLITSRYRVPWLSLTAYLHALEQAKRLRDAGIVCNVAFEKGLVTCTYSRVGWLQRLRSIRLLLRVLRKSRSSNSQHHQR